MSISVICCDYPRTAILGSIRPHRRESTMRIGFVAMLAVVVLFSGCHAKPPTNEVMSIDIASMDEALTKKRYSAGAFVSVSGPDDNERVANWISRDVCMTQFGSQTRRLMEYWQTDSVDCTVRLVLESETVPQRYYDVAFTSP